MNGTPRLSSGYPATPATTRRDKNLQETPASVESVSTTAPENAPSAGTSAPLIPLTVLDAPQQRRYALAVYALLWAWKLYDWLSVVEDGDASWWLFLKWILIDFTYLFGLPELRIPWLELSQFMVTSVFSAHLILNYMLMFNIPVSFTGLIPARTTAFPFPC
jgi:nucleoporin POM152